MTYTVWYKSIGQIFWHRLLNVRGDGFVETNAARWFILDDETRIEISCNNMIFKFSKDRWMMIKKSMEEDIHQPIITKL
jgi:hypothetical protein